MLRYALTYADVADCFSIAQIHKAKETIQKGLAVAPEGISVCVCPVFVRVCVLCVCVCVKERER